MGKSTIYRCTCTPVSRYNGQYTDVHVHLYQGIMDIYTDLHVHLYQGIMDNIQMYMYTCIKVYWTYIQMYCTCTPVSRYNGQYTDVHVHLYQGIIDNIQMYMYTCIKVHCIMDNIQMYMYTCIKV